MPKNILFESAVYQFLKAAKYLGESNLHIDSQTKSAWAQVLDSLEFQYLGQSRVRMTWGEPEKQSSEFSFSGAKLYVRGDSKEFAHKQREISSVETKDGYEEKNFEFFKERAIEFGRAAGIELQPHGGLN